MLSTVSWETTGQDMWLMSRARMRSLSAPMYTVLGEQMLSLTHLIAFLLTMDSETSQLDDAKNLSTNPF